jgi:Trp operon repressor
MNPLTKQQVSAKQPSVQQQIMQMHASLIVLVVQVAQNPTHRQQLDDILKVSADNGWTDLVRVIYKIIAGNHSASLQQNLDSEDAVIIGAILRGIQDPATLPDPEAESGDSTMAAPSIAHMIIQASTGNTQALTMLSIMAEQMSAAGGDMRHLGSIMKKLLDGERDPGILCEGMGASGISLVHSILSELATLQAH